jgi:hypothetical protein
MNSNDFHEGEEVHKEPRSLPERGSFDGRRYTLRGLQRLTVGCFADAVAADAWPVQGIGH